MKITNTELKRLLSLKREQPIMIVLPGQQRPKKVPENCLVIKFHER